MREAYYFALTLHAPVILNDELLRYRGTIDAETLKDQLAQHTTNNLDELDLRCVYQQAHIQRITGWQVLWGTPKTSEHAIEAGSVFLFKCPDCAKRYHPRGALQARDAGDRQTTTRRFWTYTYLG